MMRLFWALWGRTPDDRREPIEREFRYTYQRYPFDDAQFFCLRASDQEAANELAIETFTEMFKSGHTVVTVFYPVIKRM